jgi:hypothetical protein
MASSSTISDVISENYQYYLNNKNAAYYRDYTDYLAGRRCCKKSINELNILNRGFLGRQRCCGNTIINSYDSYQRYLRDKNCCANLVILNTYSKYIKKN